MSETDRVAAELQADIQRARAEWFRNFRRRVDVMEQLMRRWADDNTPTPGGDP